MNSYLHTHEYLAVAQSRQTYIYSQDGVQLHRLKELQDVECLDFLPYHWLLVSVGNQGHLKWVDTTTGVIVSSHKTKLGACKTMAQNIHNAVIYLGHHNGRVIPVIMIV